MSVLLRLIFNGCVGTGMRGEGRGMSPTGEKVASDVRTADDVDFTSEIVRFLFFFFIARSRSA